MVIEKNLLELLNSWWKEGKVSKKLAPVYKRRVFEEIKILSKKRQITVITGLRRVGKSTLMYQIIDSLIQAEINPENILYFSFDEKVESLLEILDEYSELTNLDWKKEHCYIFFDEIQKLSDWSNKLKIIYDNFHNLKIIISGSGSFQLEKEAKVNLAGRHFVVETEPLSFEEYLELKNSKIDLKKKNLWGREIGSEVESFLLRPYPEIVSYEELNLVKSYIKDNVVEKVLKIDLSEKFKDINEELATNLLNIFYDEPGMYLNLDELSNDLKIGKSTLTNHLFYLEFARLIRRVKNYRPKSRTTSRKLQRIYPFHWSLQFGWSGKINFETIVSSVLDAKNYWRKNGKEVDFLIRKNNKIYPIEVKEGRDISKSDLSSLIFFMKQFKVLESFLIYNGSAEEIKINRFIIRKISLNDLLINKKKFFQD